MLNLSKRDADVAIRPAKDPPETLIGRRIAKIAFAIYGSPDYLAKHREVDHLAAHQWVGPDDSLAGTSVAQWMRSQLPDSEITLRADSLLGLCQAARQVSASRRSRVTWEIRPPTSCACTAPSQQWRRRFGF